MGAMLYFEMKIFLSLLIFIFSFQSISKAEVVIDNIFGVKLYSDISKYADVENGKKRDDMPKIYTFINKDISIERDDEFTEYYLRTDENYKVVNVTAAKNLSLSIDEFTNKCSIDKKNFISNLAQSLEHVSNTTVPLAKVAFAASLLAESIQDNLDEQTKDIVEKLK